MLERYLNNKHKEHYKPDTTLAHREKNLADIEKVQALKSDDSNTDIETNKYIIKLNNESGISVKDLIGESDG